MLLAMAECRRLVRRIRQPLDNARITFRGDGHNVRPHAMAWREAHGVDYIFGLTRSAPLLKKVDEAADAVRAVFGKPVVRVYVETHRWAKSRSRDPRSAIWQRRSSRRCASGCSDRRAGRRNVQSRALGPRRLLSGSGSVPLLPVALIPRGP